MEPYSFLITAYSKVKAEELKLSIESMLNQTVKPSQIVVVYDGPVKDEVNHLVMDYLQNNKGLFDVLSLSTNQGLAAALNVGLKNCKYDLVARMDSDDYSLPYRCEKQLQEFERDKDLVLLGANSQTFVGDPSNPIEKYSNFPTNLEDIKKCIRRNTAFSHPTVMFRKSAVIECGGYDPIMRRSQDHDLFARMISKGCVCRNLKEPLLLFRRDEDCVLRNRNKESCKARIKIQERLLKRHQCSIWDYIYVCTCVRIVIFIPKKLYLHLYSLIKKK